MRVFVAPAGLSSDAGSLTAARSPRGARSASNQEPGWGKRKLETRRLAGLTRSERLLGAEPSASLNEFVGGGHARAPTQEKRRSGAADSQATCVSCTSHDGRQQIVFLAS